MKKLFTLAIIALLLSFTSCSKEEVVDPAVSKSNVEITEEKLIGKWKLVDYYSEDVSYDISYNGLTLKNKIEIEGISYSNVQEFTANKKFTSSGTIKFKITTTNQIGSESLEQEIPSVFPEGIWSLDKNTLTITNTDVDVSPKATIEKLDDTTLVLKTDLSTVPFISLNMPVEPTNMKGYIYMKLTKVN